MASLGAYVQDEWKVRRNITLTLGLRIEHDNDPACLDNCFARMNTQFGTSGYVGGASIPYNQTITTGLHNMYQSLQSIIWEPRFGLAWNLGHNTSLRGGIGSFSSLFAGSVASSIYRNPPSVYAPTVQFGEVGLPSDPASSAAAALSARNAFESGFAAGDTLTQLQAAVAPIHFAAPNYYSPPNNFVVPEVTEWSFGLEHGFTGHDVLALTYAGNHSYNQSLSNGFANGFLLLTNGTNKYYGTSFGGLPTSAPDPRFLTVTQILLQGYSNYDGLTTAWRHSMHWGFQGELGWTWSHALGLSSVYNPYNLNFGYGNESIDVRHAITGDLVWKEPHKFSNKFVNGALGGWNFALKYYEYTGRPFSSSDSKISAQINSGGGISGTFLASLVTPVNPVCTAINGSAPPCFTASNFMTYNSTSGVNTPVQTNFGITGPGVFRGPGYFDVDTNLYKRFAIHEKYGLELGVQAFNVLNHPNFSNPTASITSGTIGTTTGDVAPPTSIYGSGQGGLVSGRNVVLTGKFMF